MIHHISLDAKNPKHVATVLAEILGAEVYPAPPNFRLDSWFVIAGDQHGTMIEVLPAGTELQPDNLEAGFHASTTPVPAYVPTHAYVSVKADADTLLAIGKREGWLTRVCDRGPFALVEFWIENRQLIEFAPPEMSGKYVALMSSHTAIKAAMANLAEA